MSKFYVMGKALSGKLSCMGTGLIYSVYLLLFLVYVLKVTKSLNILLNFEKGLMWITLAYFM